MKKTIKKRNITICFLFLIIVFLIAFNVIRDNTSFIDTIEILGQNFKLEPGIYVYEFDIDNSTISKDDSGTGCKPEYTYSISKIYKNSYDNTSGIKFFVKGQSYADFRLKFSRKDNVVAYYYFTLNFDKPLEIAEGC